MSARLRLRVSANASHASVAGVRWQATAELCTVGEGSSSRGNARLHTSRPVTKAAPLQPLPSSHQVQRSLHQTGRALGKTHPLAQHRLQSMQVALPDRAFGEGVFDSDLDLAQLLAQWRARHRHDDKGKAPVRGDGPTREIEEHMKASARGSGIEVRLPEDFFSSQCAKRKLEEPILVEHRPEEAKEEIMESPVGDQTHVRKSHQYWLASTGKEARSKVLADSVARIIGGTYDLDILARESMASLCDDFEALAYEEQSVRFHQLQLAIFNHWIYSARDGIGKLNVQPKFASLFHDICQALYESLRPEDAQQNALKSSAHRHLHRTVLHRAFDIFLEISKHSSLAVEAQASALSFCAQLLRDPNLKASQARYLSRRFFTRLNSAMRPVQKDIRRFPYDVVWKEMRTTYTHLLNSRTLVSSGKSGSEQRLAQQSSFDHLGELRRLAGKAAYTRAASPWILDEVIVVMAPYLRDVTSNILGASQSSDINTIVGQLVQAGAFNAAYELFHTCPPPQRSFCALLLLMQRWSSTSLAPVLGNEGLSTAAAVSGCQLPDDDRSSHLLSCALPWLDRTHAAYKARLISLLEARFAYHAKCGKARAVIDDIGIARSCLAQFDETIANKKVVDILATLSDNVQLRAVRAFASGSKWTTAVSLARRLATRAVQDQERRVSHHLPTRLLNVLMAEALKKSITDNLARLSRRDQVIVGPSSAAHKIRRAPSRRVQISRVLTFIERFCTVTKTVPDDGSRLILLNALAMLSSSTLNRSLLDRLADQVNWDWSKRGVPKVIADVRLLLREGRRNRFQSPIPARAQSNPVSAAARAPLSPSPRSMTTFLSRRSQSLYRPIKIGLCRSRRGLASRDRV